MAHYSIKELEHLSGIKAHTLRIWEQRYQLLCPKRTATNIRYYDDGDLKNLLNVAFLNQEGFKISKIAKLKPEQVVEEVLKLNSANVTHEQLIHQLILAMVELDEDLFERALSRAVLQLGFMAAMQEVIYPFLIRIGLLWQTDNITPAHEHFMSNLIRQKVLVAIDGHPIRRKESAKRFLLYLPEGELHEIGLLYMHYLLRVEGQHILYLGQNLPLSDLVQAAKQYQPHHICTIATATSVRERMGEHLEEVISLLPEVSLLFSGPLPNQLLLENLPSQVTYFKQVQEFIHWLQA